MIARDGISSAIMLRGEGQNSSGKTMHSRPDDVRERMNPSQ
jgi:hypothetical protein